MNKARPIPIAPGRRRRARRSAHRRIGRASPRRTASGIVDGGDDLLGLRAGGRIAKLDVREGDKVVAGKSLLVEPADWPAQAWSRPHAQPPAAAGDARQARGRRLEEIAVGAAREDRRGQQKKWSWPAPEDIAYARRLDAAEAAVDKAAATSTALKPAISAVVPADVDNAEIAPGAGDRGYATKDQYEPVRSGSRREDIAQATARANEQAASRSRLGGGSCRGHPHRPRAGGRRRGSRSGSRR